MPIAPETYRKIIAAKWYMDEHFHEPIDLDRLSREACLSRYYFHRLFTRIYRRTPHQYLTQKRLRQARQWLADKEPSISDICNNVGFESIGSFSSLFKKTIGYTPQFYRNRALHQQQQARQQPRSFIPQCFANSFATPDPATPQPDPQQ
ncbi:MAG TPA: AraC family transcriptional regulator [Puia sp.]|nr:AraC family transcriptional regulator [Puia sp.]